MLVDFVTALLRQSVKTRIPLKSDVEDFRNLAKATISGLGYQVDSQDGVWLVYKSPSRMQLLCWQTRVRIEPDAAILEGIFPDVGNLKLSIEQQLGIEDKTKPMPGCAIGGWGICVVLLTIALFSTIDWEGGAITYLAWSPDGKQIAFSSVRHSMDRIYVMDADGSRLHRITGLFTGGEQPAWSPDGNKIAFISGRRVCIMAANGDHVRCLTDASMWVQYPAWSPEGNRIAFQVVVDKDKGIYVIDIDGNRLRHLSDTFAGHEVDGWPPAWSPDGSKIAFAADLGEGKGIYVVNANGDNLYRLTGSGRHPIWSRDGNEIVFDDGSYAVSIAGGDVRRLAPAEASYDSAGPFSAWSPDRSQRVFSGYVNRDSGDIYVENADGSNSRRLTYYNLWQRLFILFPW